MAIPPKVTGTGTKPVQPRTEGTPKAPPHKAPSDFESITPKDLQKIWWLFAPGGDYYVKDSSYTLFSKWKF